MTHVVSEAARTLGISRKTVQRYLAENPALRLVSGEIDLGGLKNHRYTVWRRAGGKGRSWGDKPKNPTRLLALKNKGQTAKQVAARGFHPGRTPAQRVEIILRELGAIPKGDPAWAALKPYLTEKVQAELRALTEKVQAELQALFSAAGARQEAQAPSA
jgi:hypothetical protein